MRILFLEVTMKKNLYPHFPPRDWRWVGGEYFSSFVLAFSSLNDCLSLSLSRIKSFFFCNFKFRYVNSKEIIELLAWRSICRIDDLTMFNFQITSAERAKSRWSFGVCECVCVRVCSKLYWRITSKCSLKPNPSIFVPRERLSDSLPDASLKWTEI